jgi:ADP-ribosylglycohydrolase
MTIAIERIERAQGCLLGQIAGDSLGSLVEFRSPADILREYPDGVRDLEKVETRTQTQPFAGRYSGLFMV